MSKDTQRLVLCISDVACYIFYMIKLLEQAIAGLERLPPREQELAAEFLLAFANPEAHYYQLSDAQVAEVESAKREIREGKIATDAEIDDVWRRFGR